MKSNQKSVTGRFSAKLPNIWKINHLLVNKPQIKGEVIREHKKNSEWNFLKEQHIKICTHSQIVLRENFMMVNACIRKEEVSNQKSKLPLLRTQSKINPNRWKEIKIKAEINVIQNRKTIQKINRRAGSLKD